MVRRPAPNVSNLGRAAEGEVVVTLDTTATENCSSVATFFALRVGAYTLVTDVTVGSLSIPTEDDLGQVDNRSAVGYVAAAVPADATEPLVIEWFEGFSDTAGTTSAPLDGIAALAGS